MEPSIDLACVYDATNVERHTDMMVERVVAAQRRALTLVDLNPLSDTYGCGDRAYWYYRTLTDFPGATWQQMMVGFAALHLLDNARTELSSGSPALEAAGAMLSWWARRQHSDGSFDEWYRNERSYCPTAITAAGAALTIHLIGDALPPAVRQQALVALERAGRWLRPRYNAAVMNQNLAAAAALQGLAWLTGKSRWGEAGEQRLARVAADQDEEGWLPEYGGADLGYSTLALDFLAACDLFGAVGARPIAARVTAFLAAVQGAGYGLPGRLGSRGTAHLFPFGALHFGADDPFAAALAARWLTGPAIRLEAGPSMDPARFDDRYFAYFYFPQLALAALQLARSGLPEMEQQLLLPALTDMPHSGIWIHRHADYSITVSRRLGGALAVETAHAPPCYHLGYELAIAGRRYSSAVWEMGALEPSGPAETRAAGRFGSTAAGVPLERLMVPFQATVRMLRSTVAAEVFHRVVKARMIAPRPTLPLQLERRVRTDCQAVEVTDRLVPGHGLAQVERVAVAGQVSMHSPSARQDPGTTVVFPETVLEMIRQRIAAGRPVQVTWRVWGDARPNARVASIDLGDG